MKDYTDNAKSRYQLFMTGYRPVIKSYIKSIQELNKQFLLSDDDIENIKIFQAWLTVYYDRFSNYLHCNITKAQFLKMFS